MQKFRETALTIRNGQVRVLPGASVSVYLADTNTLAVIYADRAGTIDLRNPFEATDTGTVEFHAADGLYDVVIEKSGFDTVRLSGVSLLEGVLSAGELTAARFGNEAAVPYAAGILIERSTQAVEYLGVIYEPKPDELNFTTSGTFEATKFQQVRGVTSADLALPGASADIGTQSNITAPAPRRIEHKLGDIVDLRDTGAVGLNGSGDAALVQDLLDDNKMIGRTIHGLRGAGLAAAFKITSGSWTLTRAINGDFEDGVHMRSDQTSGQRFDALKVNVTQTEGETTPSTAGEYRNGWFRGGRIFTYNTTAGAAQTLAGGYAFHVDGSGKATIGLTIEKMVLGGGLGAGRFSSEGGREIQWSGLWRAHLTNGWVFEGEDGEVAVDCVSGGANVGYTFDVTEGAFSCGVRQGTIANIGGSVDIVNGSHIDLTGVQMEVGYGAPVAYTSGLVMTDPSQTVTYSGSVYAPKPADIPFTTSGTFETAKFRLARTDLPGGAMVCIRGTDYPALGNAVVGNNLGAGVNVTNTINLFRAWRTVIDRNQFNIAGPTGTEADLLINRDTDDPEADTYDTIVGYHNTYRGPRALLSAVGTMTDVSRRMVITQNGGALRQPQRGMWMDVYSMLTDKASNLASDGFELMIEASGRIAINGGFTRTSGYFTNGLTVCRFPTKFCLPVRTELLSVMDDIGNHTTAYLFVGGGSDGLLVINGAQLGIEAYNGSLTYMPGKRVSNGGTDYVCIAPTVGNAPPNASYWAVAGAAKLRFASTWMAVVDPDYRETV